MQGEPLQLLLGNALLYSKTLPDNRPKMHAVCSSSAPLRCILAAILDGDLPVSVHHNCRYKGLLFLTTPAGLQVSHFEKGNLGGLDLQREAATQYR